jgi:NAD+ diphosphatase
LKELLPMTAPFVPAIEPPTLSSAPALWFLFQNDKLLVQTNGTDLGLPLVDGPNELGIAVPIRHYLGSLNGTDCYAAEMSPDADIPAGAAVEGLRALYGRLDEQQFMVAGRAIQIVTWDRTHRFCGQCGTATELVPGERARKCPACQLTAYPRISPAIIVLITRGHEVLLARGRNFPSGFYSTPAGFVEPGETLEEAVAREIKEEVGINVTDIRYFGSQPWPYPHQMMIGFTATWESGDIVIDTNEIADARWFTRDDMPRIPPRMSISRVLIDSYLDADESTT